MNTAQIVLTYQPSLGWNYAVLRNNKPLPAEDPQDFDTVARALQAAMLQLQATVREEREASR